MHDTYNEHERRETADGRFWNVHEFYMAYGDHWQRPWEQGAERRAQRVREAEQATRPADAAASQINNNTPSFQDRAAPIGSAPMGTEVGTVEPPAPGAARGTRSLARRYKSPHEPLRSSSYRLQHCLVYDRTGLLSTSHVSRFSRLSAL